MFSFNGRTDGDAKKCWPLDVAVLEDGTPVITDFHNKKIKAFDATGTVMGEVNVYTFNAKLSTCTSTHILFIFQCQKCDFRNMCSPYHLIEAIFEFLI